MSGRCVERLLNKMVGDPMQYVGRFLTNLSINSIEVGYQNPGQPPVFLKTYDDTGLAESFSVNPRYADIPMPRTEFTPDEYDYVLSRLEDTKYITSLEVMLLVGDVERSFASLWPEGYFYDKPPLILRQINDDGFPVAYSINWDAYELTKTARGLEITIKK